MSTLFDLSKLGATQGTSATKAVSTDSKNKASLNMDDFLKLMVAMFQYQDIENAASTTDMLNQMVQMTVVQSLTDISSVVSESNTLSYAASLVGKEVTIGQYNASGTLDEIVGTVTGTGTLNNKQVIFIGDKSYYMTDIMAVGKLPANAEPKATGK